LEAASLNALVDTPELRKARGAFFTPVEVAQYFCEWAIRAAPTDQVYEPSCGEADFLLAAGRRLRDLGAGRVDGELLAGAELYEDSAREALAELGAHGMTADVTVRQLFKTGIRSELVRGWTELNGAASFEAGKWRVGKLRRSYSVVPD
jgi:adenine-specific DNA-methyltransferase